MKKLNLPLITLSLFGAVTAVSAAPAPGERLSFVSCPIVRDTSSVPCFLSDYEGDSYYLTIQSDVSASVQPPLLGHQVLVEGIVTDQPAICGGIVLDQVHLSAMPELDANCNTMLPADDRYVIDFNPRPPGPSAGRLAFDPAPGAPSVEPPPPEGRQEFNIYFDFDKGISFRHPRFLSDILSTAEILKPSGMLVTGVRGAHRLTDGSLLLESANVGQRRAEEVAGLLLEAGIGVDSELNWIGDEANADGVDDWQSRRVTVILVP
jgi:hypothetical protein